MTAPLLIEKTEETPTIVLDAERGIFLFADTSWPEDAVLFYKPIYSWLEEYLQNPNDITLVDFQMNYFNTASAKQIAKILILFQHYSSKCNIRINWFYESDDKDMLRAGNRFSTLLNMKFEMIELPSQAIV